MMLDIFWSRVTDNQLKFVNKFVKFVEQMQWVIKWLVYSRLFKDEWILCLCWSFNSFKFHIFKEMFLKIRCFGNLVIAHLCFEKGSWQNNFDYIYIYISHSRRRIHQKIYNAQIAGEWIRLGWDINYQLKGKITWLGRGQDKSGIKFTSCEIFVSYFFFLLIFQLLIASHARTLVEQGIRK